jgi:hypothetical protein
MKISMINKNSRIANQKLLLKIKAKHLKIRIRTNNNIIINKKSNTLNLIMNMKILKIETS